MAIVKTDVYDVQAPFPLDLRLVVPNTTARDNIPVAARYNGMPVWVVAEARAYRLIGALDDNDNWVQVWPAPSGGAGNVTASTANPSGGEDGDSWFQQQGTEVKVHQKIAGAWAEKGSFLGGGKMFTHVASGDGETVVFTVPHGLPYTPTMVMAVPNTEAAKGFITVERGNAKPGVNFYCEVDATNVTITYYRNSSPWPGSGAPDPGTDNLKWTILVS